MVRQLQNLPFADIGNARIDHHRALRQGLPEAIYAAKTPEDVSLIIDELLTNGSGPVVLTRANKEQISAALSVNSNGTVINKRQLYGDLNQPAKKISLRLPLELQICLF